MTLQEMRDELVRRGLLREEEERYCRGGHSRFPGGPFARHTGTNSNRAVLYPSVLRRMRERQASQKDASEPGPKDHKGSGS